MHQIVGGLSPNQSAGIAKIEFQWDRNDKGLLTGELALKNVSDRKILRYRAFWEITSPVFEDTESFQIKSTEKRIIYLTEERLSLLPGESLVFTPQAQSDASCVFDRVSEGVEYLGENSYWYRYIKTEDATGSGSFTKEEIKIM